MKTKILFFLILLSVNVLAQKIDEEQVPKDVLIGLETIYPEAKSKSWEIKEGNYFASIKVDGQSGKAEITPNGKWIASKFPVGEKELPSTIVNYFYENYVGYKITISQYIEEPNDNNYYYLKIQKKGLSQVENGELFFDLKGNLTKNTAPELIKIAPEVKNEVVVEEEKPVKNKKVEKRKEPTIKEEKTTKAEKPIAKPKPESKVKAEKPIPTPKSEPKAEKPEKVNKKKVEEEEELPSNSANTPVVVKKYFEKKFPKAEEVEWKQVDSNYVVAFIFHEMEQKAEFAPDGKMVSTTTIMDPKNIFRPLENYLIKKYDKYKVVKAEKVLYDRIYQKIFPEKKLKNYYYVEISQKVKGSKIPKITKLWFDGAGAIDRVEQEDIEDDTNYNKEEKKDKHDKSFEEKVGE